MLGVRVVVLVFLALAIAAHARSDGGRTESEPYVAGVTFTGGNTATGCLTMANAADACFVVLPGDYSVTMVIEELDGSRVGGAAKFFDAGFGFVGATGTFCGTASALVPGAAAYLVVYPQYFVATAAACDTGLLPQNGAKVGFISVTFA